MPLVPMRAILEATEKYNYAQGAFNVNAVAQAKAVIEVHEMFRSAAIIQGADLANAFMGGRTDFANGTLEDKKVGANNIAKAVKQYAENSPIPVALHLDHGKTIDSCVAAMDGGYTSVMIDGSSLPFEDNIALTREVVKLAHARGVTVEGELGVLAGVEDHVFSATSTYTNPLDAIKFIKATGVDALAHAIECWTSNKANPFSDLYALEGLDLILNNIEKACDDPDAMAEKNRMQIAAYYGGLAITASGTTAVHALSYPLGGKYHIAHGVSNAILLAPVMRFNSEHPAVRERLAAAYDRCCHENKTCTTVEEKAAWMIARLEAIVKHLDIPTSLKEFGVPAEDLEGLVESGMQVQRLLVNNMRPVTADDARKLYQEIM